MPFQKACTGKCKNGTCRKPRAWVVAACDGMFSIFEKNEAGVALLKYKDKHAVFSSAERFQQIVEEKSAAHPFDQLVIVGSPEDIAWAHSSLPPNVANYITAEIKYPLHSNWFEEPFALPQLTTAIHSILFPLSVSSDKP